MINHELWKHRFDGCSEVGRYCGPVPAKPIRKPAVGRVFVFGDAAGLCKPTTGGGIGPGFLHVDNSLELISNVIGSDRPNLNATDRLARQIIKPIMKRHNRARALRDFFLTNSTDEELESIFRIWARPDVIEIIQKYGEIENPVPLGLKMLKDVPEFRRIAIRAANSLVFA